MDAEDVISEVESRIGYKFQDRSLLETALTHSSFAHEYAQANGPDPEVAHYERFEFLGDSVLSLVISDLIMKEFPDAAEGELTRVRASLVCADRLAEVAKNLGLGDGLKLGKGEEATGGREKPSILADTVESVIAAIYLDGGFEKARDFVLQNFSDLVKKTPLVELLGDYKTPLQEKVQAALKITPQYRVIGEQGPDHMKTFEVELIINGRRYSRGRGRSKKEAEQDAARKALLAGIFDD